MKVIGQLAAKYDKTEHIRSLPPLFFLEKKQNRRGDTTPCSFRKEPKGNVHFLRPFSSKRAELERSHAREKEPFESLDKGRL